MDSFARLSSETPRRRARHPQLEISSGSDSSVQVSAPSTRPNQVVLDPIGLLQATEPSPQQGIPLEKLPYAKSPTKRQHLSLDKCLKFMRGYIHVAGEQRGYTSKAQFYKAVGEEVRSRYSFSVGCPQRNAKRLTTAYRK